VYERNGGVQRDRRLRWCRDRDRKTVDSSGNSSSSNTTGLSVAVAYLANIKETSISASLRTDLFSKSQEHRDQQQLWLGISFGYNIQ